MFIWKGIIWNAVNIQAMLLIALTFIGSVTVFYWVILYPIIRFLHKLGERHHKNKNQERL